MFDILVFNILLAAFVFVLLVSLAMLCFRHHTPLKKSQPLKRYKISYVPADSYKFDSVIIVATDARQALKRFTKMTVYKELHVSYAFAEEVKDEEYTESS